MNVKQMRDRLREIEEDEKCAVCGCRPVRFCKVIVEDGKVRHRWTCRDHPGKGAWDPFDAAGLL